MMMGIETGLYDLDSNPVELSALGLKTQDIADPDSGKRNTIRGYEGTAAETYTKANNFKFVSLGKADSDTAPVTGTALTGGGSMMLLGIVIGALITRTLNRKKENSEQKA